MKKSRRYYKYLCVAIIGLLMGCSSTVEKVAIDKTSNPNEEVTRLENDINNAYTNHYDVLAEEDFNQSIKRLSNAKEGLRKGRTQEDVLEDIGYGRAYLQRAKTTTEQRQSKAQGVLDARKAAIDAGARSYSHLRDKLDDLDDDLRSDVRNLDKDLSSNEYSGLQQGYQNLHLEVIQSIQLGNARAMITGAKNNGAERRAPNTLKQAEIAFRNAENTISINRNNPETYKDAVTKANQSAKLLVDVVALTKQKNLDETTAVNLVKQDYEIKRLRGEVDQTESSLAKRGQQLDKAEAANAVQKTLEHARTQFDEEEAEVYQQGDKLLIRLKSIAFPSGRAELPSRSLAILAKVSNIAEELNPSKILVEGHTDSTGSLAENQKLSQLRASTVAEYLQAQGFEKSKIDSAGHAFKKPIATNKSPEGRAQNRRVDIIITPGNESM